MNPPYDQDQPDLPDDDGDDLDELGGGEYSGEHPDQPEIPTQQPPEP
jgi:hypothetical protein